MPVRQQACDLMFCQPFAALALGGHASVDGNNPETQDRNGEGHEQQRLMPMQA
jgi:hypothetical protein